MDISQYDTVLNSQHQQKSRKHKKVSIDIFGDEKVVTFSSKTSILTEKTLFQITNKIEKQQKWFQNQSEQLLCYTLIMKNDLILFALSKL